MNRKKPIRVCLAALRHPYTLYYFCKKKKKKQIGGLHNMNSVKFDDAEKGNIVLW